MCSGVSIQSLCGVGIDRYCANHTPRTSVSVLTRGSYCATFLLCQKACGIWRGWGNDKLRYQTKTWRLLILSTSYLLSASSWLSCVCVFTSHKKDTPARWSPGGGGGVDLEEEEIYSMLTLEYLKHLRGFPGTWVF